MTNIIVVDRPELIDGTCVFTHPAPHHADEVMATAMLSLLNPSAPLFVCRTRDKNILQNVIGKHIVYDVGGDYNPAKLIFDHHQIGFSEVRPNGIKYASTGLIWRDLGIQILDSLNIPREHADYIHRKIDYSMIEDIDARDNGQNDDNGKMTTSSIFMMFNGSMTDAYTGNQEFVDACELASMLLRKKIDYLHKLAKDKAYIETLLDQIKCPVMLMPNFVEGWKELVLESDVPQAKGLLYGVYPDYGRFAISAVPLSIDHQMQWRKPFPTDWRGLEGKDLCKKTGVDTAIFCHVSGFFAVAEAKEDALKMAKIAAIGGARAASMAC